ncbi:hypothetical protein [Nocardia altamirensis]|uniref:hypothetical protein n=1 Tax=Nocardia altamirensis TaxID=472158 RepID=UPI00114CCEF2|nr:hypothetical protein [Nocardia altamirensis]
MVARSFVRQELTESAAGLTSAEKTSHVSAVADTGGVPNDERPVPDVVLPSTALVADPDSGSILGPDGYPIPQPGHVPNPGQRTGPTQPAQPNPPPAQPNPQPGQNQQPGVNPNPAVPGPAGNGGQAPPNVPNPPNASAPPADNAPAPQPAAEAPQPPVRPADEHIFGLPDTTGHKEGDTWEEVLPGGIRRTNTIPYGNGTATVDQVIYNADGTTTWSRVVANNEGGYQRWNNDSTGNASYYNSGGLGEWGEGQSFRPGSSTSGAPDSGFAASPDWSATGTTARDTEGNPIGVDIGVRNKDGLYDNTYRDLHGNETYTRTKRNADGTFGSELAGHVDSTGHGWRMDEQNRRWDVFVDDNGNGARRRFDPATGEWSFVYKEGENTKSETKDASGHLVKEAVVGPNGELLSSWLREGDLIIQGALRGDGKFDYRFTELDEKRRGTIEYLNDGRFKMIYDNGDVKTFDKDGKEIRQPWNPSKLKEGGAPFALAIVKAAGGAIVGLGGISGVNDVINAGGIVLGRQSNLLPSKQETLDSFEQSVNSFEDAVRAYVTVSTKEFAMYGAGRQGLGDTLGNIGPSFLNVLNEESKLIIGTDWKEFPYDPWGTLGTATFGVGSFVVPVKMPGVPKRVPLGVVDASGQVGKTAAAALRGPDIPGNIGHGSVDFPIPGKLPAAPARMPSWLSNAATKSINAWDRLPQQMGNWWARVDTKITEKIQTTFGAGHLGVDLAVAGHAVPNLLGREASALGKIFADMGTAAKGLAEILADLQGRAINIGRNFAQASRGGGGGATRPPVITTVRPKTRGTIVNVDTLLPDGTLLKAGEHKIFVNGDVTYYLDKNGDPRAAVGKLDPPNPYKKRGVGSVKQIGFIDGIDNRGHMLPEAGFKDYKDVNVQENLYAQQENSNLSPKKIWENALVAYAKKHPGVRAQATIMARDATGRPTWSRYSAYDAQGREIPGFRVEIDNPKIKGPHSTTIPPNPAYPTP